MFEKDLKILICCCIKMISDKYNIMLERYDSDNIVHDVLHKR